MFDVHEIVQVPRILGQSGKRWSVLALEDNGAIRQTLLSPIGRDSLPETFEKRMRDLVD